MARVGTQVGGCEDCLLFQAAKAKDADDQGDDDLAPAICDVSILDNDVDVMPMVNLLIGEKWVLEDACRWTIFEDLEDELKHHKKRSRVLGHFAKAVIELTEENARLQEAGCDLQDAFEKLKGDAVEAAGDAAYWKTLAEDHKEQLEEAQGALNEARASAAAVVTAADVTPSHPDAEATPSSAPSPAPSLPQSPHSPQTPRAPTSEVATVQLTATDARPHSTPSQRARPTLEFFTPDPGSALVKPKFDLTISEEPTCSPIARIPTPVRSPMAALPCPDRDELVRLREENSHWRALADARAVEIGTLRKQQDVSTVPSTPRGGGGVGRRGSLGSESSATPSCMTPRSPMEGVHRNLFAPRRARGAANVSCQQPRASVSASASGLRRSMSASSGLGAPMRRKEDGAQSVSNSSIGDLSEEYDSSSCPSTPRSGSTTPCPGTPRPSNTPASRRSSAGSAVVSSTSGSYARLHGSTVGSRRNSLDIGPPMRRSHAATVTPPPSSWESSPVAPAYRRPSATQGLRTTPPTPSAPPGAHGNAEATLLSPEADRPPPEGAQEDQASPAKRVTDIIGLFERRHSRMNEDSSRPRRPNSADGPRTRTPASTTCTPRVVLVATPRASSAGRLSRQPSR